MIKSREISTIIRLIHRIIKKTLKKQGIEKNKLKYFKEKRTNNEKSK